MADTVRGARAHNLQRVQTEYIIAVLHINFSVLIDHKLPAVIAFYNVAGSHQFSPSGSQNFLHQLSFWNGLQ